MNSNLVEVLQHLWEKGTHIMTAKTIINKDFGPEKWFVQDLIPELAVIGISGAPESYKTWFTLELVKCIAEGTAFIGLNTLQSNVLIINKEDNAKHLQKRLRQLGMPESESVFFLTDNDDFWIDGDESFAYLVDTIERLQVKLVIFDALVRMHKGDENDTRQMAAVMARFRNLTNLGVTVIFVHHHRKEKVGTKKTPNSMRGSSDILAALDCLLMIEYSENKKSITVEQAKLKQGLKRKPFTVCVESDPTKEKDSIKFLYGGLYDPTKNARDEIKNAITATLAGRSEITRKEIIEIFEEEYSKNTIESAVKELLTEDKLVKEAGPSNKSIFRLKK